MRDRSKTLTVINTGARKKSSETSVVTQYVGGGGGGSSASGVFLEKAIWDKVWEIRSTEAGEEYIFGKLPVALQYGLTSFVDGGSLDLQDIYDGLTIDNQTIYWEKTEVESTDEEGNIVTEVIKVLKSKGGSGEGTINGVKEQGSGNAFTSVSLNSEGTELIFTKELTFAEKSYVDDNFVKKEQEEGGFVTLNTYQQIEGRKDFIGGLEVNGCELVYDSENKYWKLYGDLLVTGGITSFADDTEFKPSTIMDGVIVDGITIKKDPDSKALYVDEDMLGGGTLEGISVSGSGNAITGATLNSDGTQILFTKAITFAELEYVNTELKKYVPIEGDCEIKGTKNFTGALQVNGQPIVYDVDGGYWKLDGDLLVTGGITSFADDTAFTPSTIMDALVLDSSTLEIDENGQLTVIGGTGGGDIDEDAVKELIESYNYTTESSVKTLVESYGYLTSSDLPTATTSVKGIASFSSTDFTVSSGKVSLAARVKIVSSLPSSSQRTTNTLYVIV